MSALCPHEPITGTHDQKHHGQLDMLTCLPPVQQSDGVRTNILLPLENATRRQHVPFTNRLFAFNLEEGNLNFLFLSRNVQQSVQDSFALVETSENHTHSSHNESSVGPGTQHDPPEIVLIP